MSYPHPAFTASGNISPRRFVKISGDYTVAQSVASSATEVAIGVSSPGTREAPIPGGSAFAAIAGDPLRVFQLAEVTELEVAVAVTAGQRLKSDANGRGVLAVAGNEYFAEVLKGQSVVNAPAIVRIVRGVVGT